MPCNDPTSDKARDDARHARCLALKTDLATLRLESGPAWTVDMLLTTLEMARFRRASAKQIGDAVGKSRNAVLGKGLRLTEKGIECLFQNLRNARHRRSVNRPAVVPSHALHSTAAPKPRSSINTEKRGPPRPPTLPVSFAVEELVIPLKERKVLSTLTDTSCRWPIGDPQHADFHFCGKARAGYAGVRLIYCEHHARRAYQPARAPNGAGADARRALLYHVQTAAAAEQSELQSDLQSAQTPPGNALEDVS